MALNKLKFNRINVTPAASEALKFNSSANGFETGSAGGAMTFIKKLTASSDSTLSFVDGSSDVVLDNTYKEYIFHVINAHPSADAKNFGFQGSTDSGSSYATTITSTHFQARHDEAGSGSHQTLDYQAGRDLAQSTSLQRLTETIGADNDESCSGILHLFNPSSTTFVKHFIWVANGVQDTPLSVNSFCAGYFNTTSAIDAIQFKFESANIDSGDIVLYGIN